MILTPPRTGVWPREHAVAPHTDGAASGRLETGAAILAAAQVTDIGLVKPRLTAFAAAHRGYADAQRELEAADTRLREAQVQLALHDTEQDAALERLAGGQGVRQWTHLGLYHAVACVFVIDALSPTVLVIAGSGVTTAANGDEVNFSLIGTTDVGGAVWTSDVALTFVGGTGRFTNASGQARYMASRAAFATDYTASATGTLAY